MEQTMKKLMIMVFTSVFFLISAGVSAQETPSINAGTQELVANEEGEAERNRRIGKGLVVLGVTGQVIAGLWLGYEFVNLFSALTYPAGAGGSQPPPFAGPLVLGGTSTALMIGGIVMTTRDQVSPSERVDLVEAQLGTPTTSAPKIQLTMRF